jgi:hypothetical protein
VEEEQTGEALGALNGIRAFTEGFGPLLFGMIMGYFEDSPLPGAPYLLPAILVTWALIHSFKVHSLLSLLSFAFFVSVYPFCSHYQFLSI